MTPAAVPQFRSSTIAAFLQEEEELVGIFRDAGRRGAFILQEDLARFEANLAHFVGAAPGAGRRQRAPTDC